ncbi:dihydroorotate dehydrogenase-like protein [Flavilitoribacter nigricans]|uniref:Dihydroorotate dehydrogenase n=1 Tax=Flavilitoribacter nigricans (strain ATCC 23147 / DSM 23189 / NBRC 102662 / NCIMB 1420 / SS-2) TaxID=1122177 RepID=A0A2D0NG57_FLAN2|nr:dihydroorotate dehydrogenase-like protein [Flavilitoribacter nigricans]PHN07457.1 dihydroorotate dehydrogenase [Flavilitoribacter nigricans DSM 23189 = NBRC 102662]
MNLQTNYLGLKLRSPIVVSACPLSENVDNIVQMEDMGAGAVVLFSLFEEQIKRESAYYESVLAATSNSFPEAQDYFPGLDDYRVGSDQYLEIIRQAKEQVDMPIIGSLNGITDAGWIEYAQLMEEAGADGLEVNVFYIPADLEMEGVAVEQRYLDIVRRIKANVQIPVAVKLNPYFSAMGNMARQLALAGADGLVLFNRFYQPDFNIYELKVNPSLEFSDASEIRLPLLWLSVLSGRVNASLAATTGVQSATEVAKYLLAGADVTMTASALYKYGIGYLETMHDDLRTWMRRMKFESVEAFKGLMSQRNIADPSAFERANYIRILEGV